MDTAEARTTMGGGAGGPVYDAFLSYSHAADELLAPRLQAGLQRFTKPWWKRQILRVFRDEGSLSANPHLWSSITDAMDGSGWFILLLSPDAAESEWVNREVEWWLEHKNPDRIIPVLTDGDFTWTDGDVNGDAVPSSLHSAFSDEPRWVDLRFARSEDQLDLRNARFRNAVADIAATVRGVPKDQLESEEIREHRRTVRTAWAAGMVVLLFALFSAAAALYALDQRGQARDQAALARTRELATVSAANLEADPERSILLALEGMKTAASVGQVLDEPVTALRQALAASRVVSRIPGGDWVVYSPDGSLLVTALGVHSAIWDADTAEQLFVLPSPEGRRAWRASFSSDGQRLAVAYEPLAEQPGPLAVLWNVATGEQVRAFDGPNTVGPALAISLDETMLGADAAGSVIVWDLEAGTERYRIDPAPGHTVWGPSFSPDGASLAVVDVGGVDEPSHVVLYEASAGGEVGSFDVGELRPVGTAFDPAGRRLAAWSQTPGGVIVWDIATRGVIRALDVSSSTVAVWSPDGRLIASSSNEGIPRLFDLETGDEIMALFGHDSLVWGLSFSPDGQYLAGAGLDSDTLVWDVSTSGRGEVAALDTPYSAFGVADGVKYDAGGDTLLVASDEGPESSVARLDATTGEALAVIPDQFSGWPNAPFLAPEFGLVASLNNDLTAALRDAETFAITDSLPEGRFALDVSDDGSRVALGSVSDDVGLVAEIGSWDEVAHLPAPIIFADLSPDGSLLAAYSGTGDGWLIDVETGEALVVFHFGQGLDVPEWFPAHFSPDGSLLGVLTLDGRAGVLDVVALRDGTPFEEALQFDITAHNGASPDAVFNVDGSLLATWGFNDKHLRVWSTEDGELVADLGTMDAFVPAFAFHPNGRHVIAEGANGTLRAFTLDVDELVEIAQARLTRSFTADECATYRIEPCPTLDEIQQG